MSTPPLSTSIDEEYIQPVDPSDFDFDGLGHSDGSEDDFIPPGLIDSSSSSESESEDDDPTYEPSDDEASVSSASPVPERDHLKPQEHEARIFNPADLLACEIKEKTAAIVPVRIGTAEGNKEAVSDIFRRLLQEYTPLPDEIWMPDAAITTETVNNNNLAIQLLLELAKHRGKVDNESIACQMAEAGFNLGQDGAIKICRKYYELWSSYVRYLKGGFKTKPPAFKLLKDFVLRHPKLVPDNFRKEIRDGAGCTKVPTGDTAELKKNSTPHSSKEIRGLPDGSDSAQVLKSVPRKPMPKRFKEALLFKSTDGVNPSPTDTSTESAIPVSLSENRQKPMPKRFKMRVSGDPVEPLRSNDGTTLPEADSTNSASFKSVRSENVVGQKPMPKRFKATIEDEDGGSPESMKSNGAAAPLDTVEDGADSVSTPVQGSGVTPAVRQKPMPKRFKVKTEAGKGESPDSFKSNGAEAPLDTIMDSANSVITPVEGTDAIPAVRQKPMPKRFKLAKLISSTDGAASGMPGGAAPGVPSDAAPGVPSGAAPGGPDGETPGVPHREAPGLPDGEAPCLPDDVAPGVSDTATPDGSAPGFSDGAAAGVSDCAG